MTKALMVIAHRGASSYAPENTLAAFDLALQLGVRHIELDVALTSDSHHEIAAILARYAELDPDFTDAAVVWLAGKIGCRAVLTVDQRDFDVYRLKSGKRFEVIKWFE